jgi:hypothetical protein
MRQVPEVALLQASSRKISSNVMEAMRLTLNEHHRKLRGVGDISDWLVSADVSGFCHTDVLGPEDDFIFCCLPRLSVASVRLSRYGV